MKKIVFLTNLLLFVFTAVLAQTKSNVPVHRDLQSRCYEYKDL